MKAMEIVSGLSMVFKKRPGNPIIDKDMLENDNQPKQTATKGDTNAEN